MMNPVRLAGRHPRHAGLLRGARHPAEYTPIGLRDANSVLDAMAAGHSGKRSVIIFD
ncbi:MAG TPA: hypothetical protein VIP98_16965 [Microlunatus sp.]